MDGGIWPLVIADIEKRNEFGIKKYGRPVMPFNGRDANRDAYEEVLDLMVYFRQRREEQKILLTEINSLLSEPYAVPSDKHIFLLQKIKLYFEQP